VFDIGPEKLVLLAFLALVLLGPDRLPSFARDAGRLLRTLRDVATGARTQLRDEIGPELADLDLRSLNPRAMITRAVLGDDTAPGSVSGKGALQRALFGDPETARDLAANDPEVKPVNAAADRPAQRPLSRSESAPFDLDAT
jgi:sec-independent protein translocase protein TatB